MFQESITKEELEVLPLKSFSGEITVVDSYELVLEAVEYLQRAALLGFDTETKPSFKRGQINKVALLQLSTADRAFLFQLHKTGLRPEIKSILANPEITKVGVAIRDDIKALQKLSFFKPGGFVELQEQVKDFGIHDFSLKKIAGIVLGVRISKSQRLTNWESPVLTEGQQAYAATDAWIAHEIFQSLSEA
ncbi:3'-5' exonuclease [Mangrovibacterium marinum]|uniref:3'-5' exonuclease n=1 Tax=Mangrovibacterium marinum TaxID=1639118 RepID=A0A2T5BZP5_9BACT|nr:3'-5' exonuclease [Mangrovibacterium marinum]PTN07769.1 3'-5' exonuclease [Mangrovibacterium marinum]